jgi:hypothetical protein
MAKLNVPERYRAGVSAIRALDEQSVQAIRAALDGTGRRESEDSTTSLGTPNDLAISALATVPTLRSVDVKRIAEAIAALHGVRSSRDVSNEEFAEDVCDAMQALPSDELRLPQAERASFKSKLLTLLNAEVFSLAAKVFDLATEDERTFCNARIVTDLRPVFGSEIEGGPKAMVVVHLLKLAYHQRGDSHENFYVSLDASDLKSLRQIIDRAELKARTLESAVKDIRVLGISKEQK